MADKTALSGGNISEESLAVSRAILAAPYAALQADSLVDPGLSGTRSVGSEDGEGVERAIALDEVPRTLLLSTLGWDVADPFFLWSTVDNGGADGGLCGEVPDGEINFRK